ncbi:tripartite motif-containing protein 3 isoform X2 [Echeneis naucrates]|nr:tripartite motif-containing protein 3-like isoform X2 [Echeneis naucrates]
MPAGKQERTKGSLSTQLSSVHAPKFQKFPAKRLLGVILTLTISFSDQFSGTMVLCEDTECSVCLLPYSRMDRIPRVLHCRHTFCDPCLETMSQVRSGLLMVGCPLCRRVTCVGRGLSLQEALWVNSRLWEQIPEDDDAAGEEQEEDKLKQETEGETLEAKQPAVQPEWEMKSWRRLSHEETL